MDWTGMLKTRRLNELIDKDYMHLTQFKTVYEALWSTGNIIEVCFVAGSVVGLLPRHCSGRVLEALTHPSMLCRAVQSLLT